MKSVIAAACLALAATTAVVPAHADSNCKDSSDSVASTGGIVDRAGLYSRPASSPTSLVVFAHGFRNSSEAWIPHLRAATEHGALAVAMDYTGLGPAPTYRGWNVSAGAADLILAAKAFLSHCSSIKNVIMFGVSMGGNASGLAVAEGATRTDGTPLFDYWFDVEGATNVIETYYEATLVALAGNQTAAQAQYDIEQEMGGTFVEKPETYLERTVVARTDDIANSGVKGAFVFHGLDDGLVPYNQGREMTTALRAFDVPTDMTTIARRGSGEAGTTISGAVGTVIDPAYESPLAGHGWEGSTTQLVIRLAHDRLHRLLDSYVSGPVDGPADREILVDDAATVSIP